MEQYKQQQRQNEKRFYDIIINEFNEIKHAITLSEELYDIIYAIKYDDAENLLKNDKERIIKELGEIGLYLFAKYNLKTEVEKYIKKTYRHFGIYITPSINYTQKRYRSLKEIYKNDKKIRYMILTYLFDKYASMCGDKAYRHVLVKLLNLYDAKKYSESKYIKIQNEVETEKLKLEKELLQKEQKILQKYQLEEKEQIAMKQKIEQMKKERFEIQEKREILKKERLEMERLEKKEKGIFNRIKNIFKNTKQIEGEQTVTFK